MSDGPIREHVLSGIADSAITANSQPAKEPVSTVTTRTVLGTEIRRGFTYHEQVFTPNSTSENWDSLIEQARETDLPIYGELRDGLLRWSGDAPGHAYLMNPSDNPEFEHGLHPRLQIDNNSTLRILVYGPAQDDAHLEELARYLQRNIHKHPHARLLMHHFDEKGLNGSNFYEGTLGHYSKEK